MEEGKPPALLPTRVAIKSLVRLCLLSPAQLYVLLETPLLKGIGLYVMRALCVVNVIWEALRSYASL